jgi:adenine-specific DNA-methyltransferase
MYPRLKLARNLLREYGLLFISIDKGEVANLRKVVDEIFGEDNFLASIVWEKRFTRSNNAKTFATLTESILCYRKSSIIEVIREPRNEKADSIYTNPDNDPRGVWTSVSYVNPATKEQRKNLVYPIVNPITGKQVDHPTNAWKYEKSSHEVHVKEDKLYWGKTGENTYPRLKKFLTEMDGGMVPVDLWDRKSTGTTDEGSKQLEELFGVKVFDFPKPHSLVQRALRLGTAENDIVLDFFSGSATTAHAVMALNADDGGKRRYIMVQLPEVCDEKSAALNAGYNTIAEIGKERIRRAGKKIKDDNANKVGIDQLDIGFRVLKIDSSNMKDVYYAPDTVQQGDLLDQVSNIREDRTPEDLLFQVLLDWGVDLSLPITQETIAGKAVFFVDGNALAACFDTGINEAFVKELAARKPLRVVFRDAGFSSDSVKINVEQIFKLVSPSTEVKAL